jgi:predicted metalloprotease
MHERLAWSFDASVLAELSADCLAGAWMATRSSRDVLSDDELDAAATALFTLKDPEQREWLDPHKHGSGLQRVHAFGEGAAAGPAACSPETLDVPKPAEPVG